MKFYDYISQALKFAINWVNEIINKLPEVGEYSGWAILIVASLAIITITNRK